MALKSPKEQEFDILSPIKFHQSFKVPPTESHGVLRVSYSITGIPLGQEAPTILFCAGMFGSRWIGMWLDYLATKTRVRVLFIGRLVGSFTLDIAPASNSQTRCVDRV